MLIGSFLTYKSTGHFCLSVIKESSEIKKGNNMSAEVGRGKDITDEEGCTTAGNVKLCIVKYSNFAGAGK